MKHFRFNHLFTHWGGDLTGGLTVAVMALPLAMALMVTSVRMIEWEAIGLLMRATYTQTLGSYVF